MSLTRKALAVGAALALCLAAVGLGSMVRMALPGLAPPVAYAQQATTTTQAALPQARVEKFTNEGVVRGKVFIGTREVIRCVWPSAELEPFERASLAAGRINLALEGGAGPEDFKAVQQQAGGPWIVVAGDRVIISVAPKEPAAYGTTEQGVAQRWATSINNALYEAFGTKPGQPKPLPPMPLEARKAVVDGNEAGVLVYNNKEVLRILAPAASMGAYDRTSIVADRIRKAVSEGAVPQDVRAADVYGMSVVQVGETLLITVDDEDARRAGKEPQALARTWASSISNAIAAHYASAGGSVQPPADEWQPTEPYEDKWVPIISVLEGVKLGMARVNGPASAVSLVQAVAQLETHWKDYVEIDVYVPISTKVPGKTLDRVKAVGVTGLGDIQL